MVITRSQPVIYLRWCIWDESLKYNFSIETISVFRVFIQKFLVQAYGRDLMEAMDWCQRYKVSGNVRDLNQAWDLYYHVFRRISRQLPSLTSLELQYVSPKLLVCRDLELAVPGSYTPGQAVVRIQHIQSSLQVITSKQRPRKLCIRGTKVKFVFF